MMVDARRVVADSRVAACGTHHVDKWGNPLYKLRFDEVLKFHEPGLAPVLHEGVAWHIRSDGTAAYPQRFLRTFGFYEGRAAVVSDDGWHHIEADGRDVYPERYSWCGNFQQGRCTVRAFDGRYHHVDDQGKAVYGERWRYAGDYRDDIAVVQAEDGRSTHIDRRGSLVHGRWFLDLDVFHKGFARARDTDGWLHIDGRGFPAYERRFALVEPFYNGQARVERFDGGLEIIDERGCVLHELRSSRRSEFAALSADMVGFWRTQTIATAVQLGVMEVLPATVEEVAEKCRLRGDGASRLLRALAELQVLRQDGWRWHVTERGSYLRSDHRLTLADAAIEYAGRFSEMWRRLPDALRESGLWSAPDVFGDVARDVKGHSGHHRMLRSYARHDYADVVRFLDLKGDERLVDAGGGLGVLAGLVREAFPSMQITVLERPDVVALVPPTEGIRWHGADLFEPWGIDADVVLLSRVLHDWDDENACRILHRAHAALPAGGKLFVIEMLIPPDGVAGALCDLHLLAVTGGRERSVQDFEELFERTGFRLVQVSKGLALPSIIQARRA